MKLISITPATSHELRQFGITFSIILVILFGLAFPWWFEYRNQAWPYVTAALLLVLAFTKPDWLSRPYVVWMTFGHYMGWLNTRIVLLLMFFVVMLPAGLVFRLATRSSRANAETYRQPKQQRDPGHMEHPY